MSLKIAISLNLDWPLSRYHDLYAGVQSYAEENTDWHLVWDHYPELALESSDKAYYDGIIGRIKYDAFKEAERLNVPMVNNWVSSTLTELPSVFIDHYQSGRIAAEHMLKRGFKNFVSIDNEDDHVADDFCRGISDVISKLGYEIKRYYIRRKADQKREDWRQFNQDFADWVPEWDFPMAICCSMSATGPRITTRLLEHGIKVPHDVSIITSGNEETYCERLNPKISSVLHDYFKVGYLSAKLLDKQLKGEVLLEKKIEVQPGGVKTRESTDAYVTEDHYLKTALRYIADNYQNNIQVNDVVNHVSLARRTIETRFRKFLGHSIMDEINHFRISKIKQLLVDTNESIKVLCGKAGFSSSLHLRRIFIREVGTTPGDFRKLYTRK